MLGTIGKILGIIFIIFIAFILVGIITVLIISKNNDAYKGNYKKEMKSQSASAPKALIIYQPSKSKASAEVADKLAEGLNAQGYDVTLTYPGKHLNKDVASYSVIGFGSPVFFGKPSAAITKTMEELTGLSGKTLIIYTVGGLAEMPELDLLRKSLQGEEPTYVAKFVVSDTERNNKAYDLGAKVGKESRGNQ